MRAIAIDVIGTPAPKGSSRAMLRGGRAVNVPGGSAANFTAIRSWSSAVAYAAHEVMRDRNRPHFVRVPLVVSAEFRFPRPMSHYGLRGTLRSNAPIAPAGPPDLDKLLRCTMDPLEGIVFDNDSRIVHFRDVIEIYTPPRQSPGARIVVDEFTLNRTLELV